MQVGQELTRGRCRYGVPMATKRPNLTGRNRGTRIALLDALDLGTVVVGMGVRQIALRFRV